MYKHFFGLRENPFNVNPDPRYLFLTPQTREALDEMTYGIQARKGLILLTGEVGTGKTTILNRLLDWLHEQQTPAAFIFNSHLEISHLFDFIMADFGIPYDPRLKGNAMMRLNQWLFERYRAGETPVMIVDEAQGLPNHVLEEIRMLLNLESPSEKLLQIVLAGQPELELRLKQPELRQVKQRITLRCKTAALTREQTHDYIRARLHIAGANGKPVFATEAMDAVYFYSRGIPRVMNLLCEHALINAYVDSVQPVPVRIVAEVAREFQYDGNRPVPPSIDSGDALDANLIATQSVFTNGLVSLTATVEPPRKEHPGILTAPFSGPFAAAANLFSPAKEPAIATLDGEQIQDEKGNVDTIGFLGIQANVPVAPEPSQIEGNRLSELTEFFSELSLQFNSGLAIEPQPDALPRFLHVVETKGRFEQLETTSLAQVSGLQVSSHPPTQVDTRKSRIVSPVLMKILDLRLFLLRWSVSWKNRIGSAAASSLDWRRRKATVYRWLRHPWDPRQWRFPDSRFFEVRRRFSYWKT
jgi:general secretion pathway protein A